MIRLPASSATALGFDVARGVPACRSPVRLRSESRSRQTRSAGQQSAATPNRGADDFILIRTFSTAFVGAKAGRLLAFAATAFAALLLAASIRAASFDWKTETPEQHGFATARLNAFRDLLAAHQTKAFLLVHDDRIIYEWYAPDHSATKTHFSASMAKALVGGVAVAVALSDGRFTLDDPVAKFVPQWRGDAVKARITFRQLGSHTSGLDDAEADDRPHDKLTGWQGDFWKRLPPPRDPFTLSRDVVPVRFAPGERMYYSNPGIAMLGYGTTAALRAANAPEQDLRAILRERIMRPIGVPDQEWSVGYGQTVMVDRLAHVAAWGGGGFTARGSARVGRLMLREGDWDGRRLIKAAAVQAVTRDAGTPANGAIGWWSNNEGIIAAMPRDAFWGAGAQHQITVVIRSRGIIAVRNGGALSRDSYDTARNTLFFQPLMTALKPTP